MNKKQHHRVKKITQSVNRSYHLSAGKEKGYLKKAMGYLAEILSIMTSAKTNDMNKSSNQSKYTDNFIMQKSIKMVANL